MGYISLLCEDVCPGLRPCSVIISTMALLVSGAVQSSLSMRVHMYVCMYESMNLRPLRMISPQFNS